MIALDAVQACLAAGTVSEVTALELVAVSYGADVPGARVLLASLDGSAPAGAA